VEWKPHSDDVPACLREAHIVVLPSYREGLPKTLIDAAAAGRPTVTTDLPGCIAAIEPGETGLVCRAADAHDLADKIAELLDNPAQRSAMGRKGRALAVSRFVVRAFVAQHLALYDGMLSCGPSLLPERLGSSGAP
jgi:glycosyltransferase involved in cell wall biosynthesis